MSETLEVEVIDKLVESILPDNISHLPYSPTHSYGYIQSPKELLIVQTHYSKLLASGKNPATMKSVERVMADKFNMYKIPVEDFDKKLMDIKVFERWIQFKPFKPSSDQLLRYIRWKIKMLKDSNDVEDNKLARKYYIPVNYKGKESTNKDTLSELAVITQDEVLEKVAELRSLIVNKNNYYPNWKPGSDGMVHPIYRWKPPTEQLNSVSPNAQNLSKHTTIGQVFRRMVKAPKGRYFVAFDKSRFHVATMGYHANSARYIRFARLDSHSIFGSWVCGIKELEVDIEKDSDETVMMKVKEVKKRFKHERDTQYKPTVLGNQLGLGPRKLYWMNRERIDKKTGKLVGIKGVKEAERLQEMIAGRFPEITNFKDMITRKAHNDEYLMNSFGGIRWFYNVLVNKWNKYKGVWVESHGTDYEKAIAYLVQTDAFGAMRYEWDKMISRGLWERYTFVNTIHDNNEFMPIADEVINCIQDISRIMNEPCKVLLNDSTMDTGGLVVNCGISIGKNMADYREDNPIGMREAKTVEEAVMIYEELRKVCPE